MHLKEILDIRTIRLSSSQWASAVMLIRKKDGKLHFCIDLRKLSQLTITDAYSIPYIEDTLDCLEGCSLVHILGLELRILAS